MEGQGSRQFQMDRDDSETKVLGGTLGEIREEYASHVPRELSPEAQEQRAGVAGPSRLGEVLSRGASRLETPASSHWILLGAWPGACTSL